MGFTKNKLGKGLLTLATAAALMLGGSTAALAAASVTGADYYGNGAIAATDSVNVLSVGGLSQDTIYLRVKQGDKIIADRLAYDLTNTNQGGSTATDANRGAVVALSIQGLNLDGTQTYTISAFDSRAENNELYTGTLYSVYAKLDGGEEVLVGTHTTNTDAIASYNPASKLYLNNTNYALDDANSQPNIEGTKIVYSYSSYNEATSATGTINYVDVNGNVISTTTVEGIGQGESKTVDIPAMVSKDNYYFRTVFFKNQVTLSNPGQLSYTITCKLMGENANADLHFYKATINMTDQDGNVFASDTVSVTGKYYYTLPSTVYKRVAGNLYVYTLDNAANQTLTFDAAADGITTGANTVAATYTRTEIGQAETKVTFNLIDGSKDASEGASRTLGTKEVTVNADSTTAAPDETITVDGTTYKIAGTTEKYAYSFGSKSYPVVNVYYLPEGYTVPTKSYTVTVNYVNFLTKETIKSSTFESVSTDNSDYQFVSEANFSLNGTDYVRLDGQEEPISHSYFSGISTYTVYYRDKNDTYNSGTVINTIRVIYTGEETTVVDGGTTDLTGAGTTNASGQTGAATTADQAAAGRLNANGTYSVADGTGNNSTLTTEGGVDSNTERINDEETPLASGEGLNQGLPAWATTAAGVGIGLAAIVIMYAIIRNRKNQEQN